MKHVGLLVFVIYQLLSAAEIQFVIGESYNSSFKMAGKTIHTTPQIAVWLEDSSGRFVQTLKVTYKTAKAKYVGHRGGREESLPVWAFARGEIDTRGRRAPSHKTALPDAVTGASKKEDFAWKLSLDSSAISRGMMLCVEVNNSMDFNHFYKEKLDESSLGYNKGVNGQPSLVFKAPLSNNRVSCELVGYGHPAGKDGEIRPVDRSLSSALSLIKTITVVMEGK